ncbi:hypothetical protein [Chitinophaga parva]|uniref:hypothetical protein n=1 Tax=Chitinophaga parva TaxID=2169414 RepID=UPI001F0CB350|nr:hypothetical protein [Chitinophaga parva]
MSLGECAQRGLLPTLVAEEGGWQGLEIVDSKGQTPTDPSLAFFSKKTGKKLQKKLSYLLQLDLLPTPTSVSDAKGGCTRKSPVLQRATLAHHMHGMAGQPGKTSQLNPRFVAQMMGFPAYWLELPFLGFIRSA